MWNKDTTLHRHYGATRIWDREHGENKDARHSGFDTIEYSDILNSNGDLTPGKRLKNQQAYCYDCKVYHTAEIYTDTARIGEGTFSNGGATGIGFNFPIYITFEINPIQEKKGNALYVSEYSIVNMADDADPDEMTTHASMQAYSNREQ